MNIKLKGMMDRRNIGKVKTLLQDIVRIRPLGELTNKAANFSTVRSSAHVLQISNGLYFMRPNSIYRVRLHYSILFREV